MKRTKHQGKYETNYNNFRDVEIILNRIGKIRPEWKEIKHVPPIGTEIRGLFTEPLQTIDNMGKTWKALQWAMELTCTYSTYMVKIGVQHSWIKVFTYLATELLEETGLPVTIAAVAWLSATGEKKRCWAIDPATQAQGLQEMPVQGKCKMMSALITNKGDSRRVVVKVTLLSINKIDFKAFFKEDELRPKLMIQQL